MFIEMLGMVGAGKTTIALTLKNLLQDREFIVLSLSEAIAYSLERSFVGRFICRFISSVRWRRRILRGLYMYGLRTIYKSCFIRANPKLTWEVYKSQIDRKIPWWHRRIILNLFFEIGTGYQFVLNRLHSNEVVVLEEGLFHRAVNLYAWEIKPLDDDRLLTYFNLLPTSGLVVFVQAPAGLCVERVKERGYPSRLRRKDPATIARFMDNAAQIIQVASIFLSTDDRRVIEVDNSGGLEASSEHLQKGFAQYLMNTVRSR